MRRITPRMDAIAAQRRSGLTYRKIGENFSITAVRASQIMKQYEAGKCTHGVILDPDRIEREWTKIDARTA